MIKPISSVNFLTKKGNVNFANGNLNLSTKPIPYDTVSFCGESMSKRDKLEELISNSKTSAMYVMDRGVEIAQKYGAKEVREEHTLLACLEVLDNYIEDLDSGATYYGEEKSSDLASFMEQFFDSNMFKKADVRKKIKPVIKDEIQLLQNMMAENGRESKIQITKPSFNTDHLSTIYAIWNQDNIEDVLAFCDSTVLNASLYPDNDEYTKKIALPFRRRLQEALMLNDTKTSEKPHIKFYDEKARNIWKNLAVGTNMFILHDKTVNPQYLVNSFEHILSVHGEQFGKLNKENTNVVVFNDNATGDYISHKIRQATKEKDKNHVLVFSTKTTNYHFSSMMEETFKNPPKNVKFVVVSEKDQYYQNVDVQDSENPFADFGEVNVPILNTEQAKKIFREENVLVSKIKKPFTPEAVDKCVEISATLSGSYPEKTQKIMDLMASYYVDNEKITVDDVMAYVKEANEVFKTVDVDSSVIVNFDTGKKLSDIVGSDGTRREANSIVRMINDKTVGTKGYIIYSQDGYPGAGRRHTAQAIAGEAKIPYIEINALDFGTKDVDLFGGGNLTPEASIKKLFGLVKSQAETNESKSAVLFIENFEYFSVGEQVSEYHQKAMSQLLREMGNAEKQGLNIVVMGSMSDPDCIGNSTLKSFKFIDKIEVESPSSKTEARREILDYYIKNKKLEIAGDDDEQKALVLSSAADTTRGFPLVELIAFLDKANNISRERGKDKIDQKDFIEAYLQITTGRPASYNMPDHSKEITSAHECGHAITAQIMSEIINKKDMPWYTSSDINFIALDPRSNYLGAVYTKRNSTQEYTFEEVFADLVLAFGGHSCEKLIYGMDGSWGITGDMQQMTSEIQTAIQYMGLGPNVGKICIQGNMFGNLDISASMREKIDKDFECFSKNANLASDKIVEAYMPFIKEFADKYKSLVGTGECVISAKQFRQELNEWREKQSAEKKAEFEKLENEIEEIISKTKEGIVVEDENKKYCPL